MTDKEKIKIKYIHEYGCAKVIDYPRQILDSTKICDCGLESQEPAKPEIESNYFDKESRKSFTAREEKLRADSKWPNTNWYNDEEFCKVYKEACDRLERSEEARLLSYKEREKLMEEIQQLQAKLEAAGERIKKLEAHICGEPTAKLQFPKETK